MGKSKSKRVASPGAHEDPDEDDVATGPSAAERGLTIETWQDRPLDANHALGAQVRNRAKDWNTTLQSLEASLNNLQDTAVAMAMAGFADDPPTFDPVDAIFKQQLDEIVIVKIRKDELKKLIARVERKDDIMDAREEYRSACKENEEAYRAQSDRQKYVKSKEYDSFRRAVWEHQGLPPQPISTLFTKVKSEVKGGDDSSDDDVEVGGVTQNFKCPISLTVLEDPYTSTTCSHSFSKKSVWEYIEINAGPSGTPCPVPGCNAKLTKTSVKPDPNLAKRVTAYQRRQQREEEERDGQADALSDDDDDDE